MERVRTLTADDLGVSTTPPRPMTDQEEATVIAALRLWQNVQDGRLILTVGPSNKVLKKSTGSPVDIEHLEDVATNLGKFPALDIDGVDTLLDDVFGVV